MSARVAVLAFDCIACHASVSDCSAEETALSDIATFRLHSFEEIERGLCFKHRRSVNDVVKAMGHDAV
jgi:hypothetical protein